MLHSEVGVAPIATLLDQHLAATRLHGDRVEARLQELGSGGSLRLIAQAMLGVTPKAILDRVRPSDARACLRDAVAAEAGEIASYLLLECEAYRAGDEDTAVLAAEIRGAEADTRDALMKLWERATDHDLARKERASGGSATRVAHVELLSHLQDVHALQRNAAIMLTTVLATVRDGVCRARVRDHRDATARHGAELATRLEELGSGSSFRRQAQGYAFAAIKGPINLVRAERAGKDMRDMYVVEHLERAAYTQLLILAERAGDERTVTLAAAHLTEGLAMIDWLERDTARFLLESIGEPMPSV